MLNRSRRIIILIVILWCLAVTSGLYGQTGSGAIQGTVRDALGAVVPRAAVILLQTMPDGGSGIFSLRSSNNLPRQSQLTARLQW
jgi:hypothetical protein